MLLSTGNYMLFKTVHLSFPRVVKVTWKASSSLSAFFTPISIILAFFCKASSSLFKVSLTFFSSASPSSMSNLKSESDCYHGILKLLSNLSNLKSQLPKKLNISEEN